jgi:hypothetical protein
MPCCPAAPLNQKYRKQPHAQIARLVGMDALARENILTRRANHRHYSSIAQFLSRSWHQPDGLFGTV